MYHVNTLVRREISLVGENLSVMVSRSNNSVSKRCIIQILFCYLSKTKKKKTKPVGQTLKALIRLLIRPHYLLNHLTKTYLKFVGDMLD